MAGLPKEEPWVGSAFFMGTHLRNNGTAKTRIAGARPLLRFLRLSRTHAGFLLASLIAVGCAHYPVNPSLDRYDPDSGYRLNNISNNINAPGNPNSLLVILTFSGGGTRSAALSYGVLEELAGTEFYREGRKRRLLDEVDLISAVSGGSFTAAYYGLFGERIFEDFESRFLKKNVQGALMWRLFFPPNWFRLLSSNFGRIDLAAEYYDKHIFESGTFDDMANRGGPAVLINATDMTRSTRFSTPRWFSFFQDQFDWICSDVSDISVARAVAASSAVPVLLSPVTLRNYAGSCNYQTPKWIPEALEKRKESSRRFHLAVYASSYIDAEKRPYIHLLDGGLADNLGLRVVMDQVILMGGLWSMLQEMGLEDTTKVVFIVSNAGTGLNIRNDQREKAPGIIQVLKSTTSAPIGRNTFETMELLRENLKKWTEEVRVLRCGTYSHLESMAATTSKAGECKDFDSYLVEVKFNDLKDESERAEMKSLPTSFKLSPEAVDRLRGSARRILAQSEEFQRLLRDLR
jgi:NTE family protein